MGTNGAQLGVDELNRAVLARQHLLARSGGGAVRVVSEVLGLQAQQAAAPGIGLWSRAAGVRAAEPAELVASGELVRAPMMRGTLHVVTAADFRALRPALQPAVRRAMAGFFGRELAAVDLDELARRAVDLVAAEPLSTGRLCTHLSVTWPDVRPAALGYAARTVAPLVSVMIGGEWGWTAREATLTAPDGDDGALRDLVRRYLTAFGPASVRDLQTWAGMSRLDPVVRGMPELVRFGAADGTALLDVADGPRPGPDTHVPVRFLPEFDNVLVSHADRGRIMDDAVRAEVCTRNGIVRPTVLVDGRVRAVWRMSRTGRAAHLQIGPFGSLSAAARAAVVDEAERLLADHAPGSAGTVEVRGDRRWS